VFFAPAGFDFQTAGSRGSSPWRAAGVQTGYIGNSLDRVHG
jgi:hypothetical protein